jgi:hypothetical protein
VVKCPHCAGTAMTLGQKASLGPGRIVRCQACGGGVAAHPVAILAALPAFMGGFAMLKSDSAVVGMAAIVAGLVAMALLHTFAVPLIKS